MIVNEDTEPLSLLKEIKGVLPLDLLDFASNVMDDKLLTCLKEPEQGIYIKGSLTPRLYIDREYYPSKFYLNRDNLIQTIDQIRFADDDILDKDGNIILSKKFIKGHIDNLSYQCSLPVTLIEVAKTVILNYLCTLCPHTRTHLHGSVFNFIRDEYIEDSLENEFNDVFENLLDTVHSFVGKDTWNIYFHEMFSTTILIKKSIDFRIYDWHRIMHDERERKHDAGEL